MFKIAADTTILLTNFSYPVMFKKFNTEPDKALYSCPIANIYTHFFAIMKEAPYKDNNHSAEKRRRTNTGTEDNKFNFTDCMANFCNLNLSLAAESSENLGAAIELTANNPNEIISPNLNAIK